MLKSELASTFSCNPSFTHIDTKPKLFADSSPQPYKEQIKIFFYKQVQ